MSFAFLVNPFACLIDQERDPPQAASLTCILCPEPRPTSPEKLLIVIGL